MGLDNYWSGNIKGYFNVCGGICSGHGNDSFRGKVYNTLVEEITGVSLYEEEISSERVVEMAESLEESLDTLSTEKYTEVYGLSLGEFEDFVAMFKAHADAGHSLKSWW